MPIQIPNDLPAAETLKQENIFVMKQTRAQTQHIRPLEIVLLNLMPTKIVTETQLSRVLGNTPLQVHLELMMISSHKSKNTPEEHLLSFYKTFDELKDRKFDGMVITGAPVENMPFEEVDYWQELCRIMAQAQQEREEGTQVLVARMNKNKRFQKEQLASQGYTDIEEFYENPIERR